MGIRIVDGAGGGGSGNMSTLVYDPAGVDEQLVGIDAIQTISNKTLIDPTIAEINGYSLIPGMSALVDGVAEFGIDNTGTVADNSTAINAALLAGAQGGYGILIPMQAGNTPAVVKLQNPIVMGNGSSSAKSTAQGGLLVGGGFPGFSGLSNAYQFAAGACELLWNGSGGATAVEVNGPLQGWGLKNLYISNPTGKGLVLSSAQFGVFEDISIDAINCILHTAVMTTTEGNCMHNVGRRISLLVENGGEGIYFGNGGTASSNACYETYEDVTFGLLATSALTYGIIFAGCDNCRVTRVHFAGGASGTYARAVDFAFDNTYFSGSQPADCQVHMADLGDYTVVSSGSANANVINTFSRLSATNGVTPNPQITGIFWDSPKPYTAGVALGSNVNLPAGATTTIQTTPSLPIGTYLVSFTTDIYYGNVNTLGVVSQLVAGTATASFAGPTAVDNYPLETLSSYYLKQYSGSVTCQVTVTVAGTLVIQGVNQDGSHAASARATDVNSGAITGVTGYTITQIAH